MTSLVYLVVGRWSLVVGRTWLLLEGPNDDLWFRIQKPR